MEKTWKVRDLHIAEIRWFEKWLNMPLGPDQEVTLRIEGEFPPIPPLPTEEELDAWEKTWNLPPDDGAAAGPTEEGTL